MLRGIIQGICWQVGIVATIVCGTIVVAIWGGLRLCGIALWPTADNKPLSAGWLTSVRDNATSIGMQLQQKSQGVAYTCAGQRYGCTLNYTTRICNDHIFLIIFDFCPVKLADVNGYYELSFGFIPNQTVS